MFLSWMETANVNCLVHCGCFRMLIESFNKAPPWKSSINSRSGTRLKKNSIWLLLCLVLLCVCALSLRPYNRFLIFYGLDCWDSLRDKFECQRKTPQFNPAAMLRDIFMQRFEAWRIPTESTDFARRHVYDGERASFL